MHKQSLQFLMVALEGLEPFEANTRCDQLLYRMILRLSGDLRLADVQLSTDWKHFLFHEEGKNFIEGKVNSAARWRRARSVLSN